jgi:5-methylcytosine-specific restriction endonuclease McrA
MEWKRAEEIERELRATNKMARWSPEALILCLKEEFRCAYCDRDFLKERDIRIDFSDCDLFNYFSHFDHLLPRSKYSSLLEERTNKVLCCVPCNRQKRDWDPNAVEPLRDPASRAPLTDEERQQFIRRTKEHLAILSQQANPFSTEKSLILEHFPGRLER